MFETPEGASRAARTLDLLTAGDVSSSAGVGSAGGMSRSVSDGTAPGSGGCERKVFTTWMRRGSAAVRGSMGVMSIHLRMFERAEKAP